MTRYPTLPAVDAYRSGWLFSSTALADGGFNRLLLNGISPLYPVALGPGFFLR